MCWLIKNQILLHIASGEGHENTDNFYLVKELTFIDVFRTDKLHFINPAKRNVIAYCEVFISQNADINLCDQYKETSFHKASNQKPETIAFQLLLSKVANVNLSNLFQETYLHKVGQKRHGGTVLILQSYSADIN